MNFSPIINQIHQLAAYEARAAREEFIHPDHFFLGLLKLVSGGQRYAQDLDQLPPEERTDQALLSSDVTDMCSLFQKAAVSVDQLRYRLRELRGVGQFVDAESHKFSRTAESKSLFGKAEDLAQQERASKVRWFHFLACLLMPELAADGDRRFEVFKEFGIDATAVLRVFREASPQAPVENRESYDLPGALPEPPAPQAPRVPGLPEAAAKHSPEPPNETQRRVTPTLDRYGRDLTEAAQEGSLSEAIGRKHEMLEICRTLERKIKNNAILVGDAGVGKTAIVEGLAWRIAQGRAPAALLNKRIIQLDMTALLAGAQYRGQYEERLQAIIREVSHAPDVILFIDEIHTVVSAGSTSGTSVDAANIMKPALGRGDMRVIGATTTKEYQRIEADPALERRFRPIRIGEPTTAETLAILRGIKPRLESRNGVTITEDALCAAVELSVRHLPNRQLPDKALDLLEEASVGMAVQWPSTLPGEGPIPHEPLLVDVESIARVVSKWTSIPLTQLTPESQARLAEMGDFLKLRVIGQEAACDSLARAVIRARSGLKSARRPVGVFLFVGPTGVGKTELAKAAAEFLFGTDRALVRVDLSEYQEKHTISRLIGAPPGYVGHEEDGQLVGPLRRNPHCVVLLDEIEKAHPDILNLFLPLFDEGRLTDSRGRVADATNALFILTSNLRTEEKPAAGFRVRGANIRNILGEQGLRVELINRIDEVVVFGTLQLPAVKRIVELQLQQLGARLSTRGVALAWSPEAAELIAQRGLSPEFGVRELSRVIVNQVENPLAGMIIRGQVSAGQQVTIEVSEAELKFTI